MQEEYREGFGKRMVGVPGGLSGPAEGAKREPVIINLICSIEDSLMQMKDYIDNLRGRLSSISIPRPMEQPELIKEQGQSPEIIERLNKILRTIRIERDTITQITNELEI